jgi:large subunit ribosomal protein L24
MAAKIKKGDTVVVLAGRDKGRSGQVLQVMPKENRALVQGINVVKAPPACSSGQGSRDHQQGSADPAFQHCAARPERRQADTRAFPDQDDGTKVRVASRSGEAIDG